MTDIGRDVLGILALEQSGRHHALGVRILDPVRDEALDRGALDPVGAILAEGVIEVGPDLPFALRVVQRVAGAALLYEQHLAMHEIAGRVLEVGPATSEHDKYRPAREQGEEATTKATDGSDHVLRAPLYPRTRRGGAVTACGPRDRSRW